MRELKTENENLQHIVQLQSKQIEAQKKELPIELAKQRVAIDKSVDEKVKASEVRTDVKVKASESRSNAKTDAAAKSGDVKVKACEDRIVARLSADKVAVTVRNDVNALKVRAAKSEEVAAKIERHILPRGAIYLKCGNKYLSALDNSRVDLKAGKGADERWELRQDKSGKYGLYSLS